MQAEIRHQPSYAITYLTLTPGEAARVEGGAMVMMSEGLEMETKAQGGLLKSLGRAALGGESFFVNTYRAPGGGGWLAVAPKMPGDMAVLELGGQTMLVQSGSFVASSEAITTDTKWGGAKTFFSSEGLFMLRCEGAGTLVMSSFGAIERMELATGQKVIMDTGHLVAMTEGMQYEIRKVGGWKSTLFSGEGLVVHVTGPGTLYTQTRSPDAFISWLAPMLPTPSTGGNNPFGG